MREFTRREQGAARLAAVAVILVAIGGCSASKSAPDGGPPPPTFSISGTVSGAVAAGVTVKIQGGSRQATTNAQGQYTLVGLLNGTYTLEASLAGYSFTPPTRTVTLGGASVTGQDFTSQAGFAIAGVVTGDGPAGATLTLMGPEPATSTRTATSDGAGSYRFSGITPGVYLVTPSRAGGWTFSPANTLVTVAGANLIGPNFASIAPTHRLSGKVRGSTVAGVTVTLSGGAAAVAVTDGTGSYAFAELAPGSYVVTPSSPGYAFAPAQRSATLGSVDVLLPDFVSTATHTLAGRISGDVLAGVGVSLSGAATGDASTDASGYYEFTDLVDGIYTVSPSLAGYTFAPAARSVTLAGADVTSATFTASAAPTYAVSGSVSGAIQKGVTVTLQGATTAVTTTDAAGAFRFEGVAPGTYLLVPSHDDYTFDRASRLVVVSTVDVAGQTFVATVSPTARTISGTVTGAATAGVTVTLVGPSPATTTRTVTTDAAGDFAFRGLTDGLYLATPSLPGFVFAPADCLVSVAGPSVTFVPFTSAFARHSLSGRVSGSTLAGVTITLDGEGAGTTATATDGTYAFADLANGAYKVTPSLAGHYFSPVEASVTLAGADVTGVDFVVAPSHRISGFVSGDVLAGVTVKLAGAAAAEATTDVTGFYEFTDLRDGGYVLTPSLTRYTFAPQLLPVDLAGADVTTADFVSTLIPTYTVTGTISGTNGASVTVALAGGSLTLTAPTDSAGVYLFTELPNGSYMVVPSLTGYGFTPASRAFRINDASVTGQDFTAAAAP